MLIHSLAALLLAVPPVPARAPVIDAASIDAVVHAYQEAARIPGLAVAVVRNGEVVHTAGYGHTANGDAVTDRTVLPVASLSKSITARAVLQLAETGRVRLDAPVRDQLPEFRMADGRAARITVRQLLDQTSGMSDTTYRSFSGPALHTLREAVASMRDARLAADPGSRFEYHNANYQVAARLVEVVSGQSFDDHLRQHVFGPLGMTGSRTIGTAAELPSGSRGHRMIAGLAVAVPEPPAFGNGSGGVLSTAHDMAAWLIAQKTTVTGPTGSYRLGWNIGTTASGAPLIDHTGGLITITAYQALLPAQGYGLVVMANAGSQYGDAPALGAQLIDLLEGRPVPAPAGAAPLIGFDIALLLIALVVAGLSVRGVRNARRWTARPATVARLLAYPIPLLILIFLDRVVSALYRGTDISWVQATFLSPAFTLLLLVTALGCTAVAAARLLRSDIRTTRQVARER